MKKFLCWLFGHEMASWASSWVEVRSKCSRCGHEERKVFWY